MRRTSIASAMADEGFTIVELIVTMFVVSIAMAIVIPILVSVSSSGATANAFAVASGRARLAIEDLQSQVGSASQVCLPTQLTGAGMTTTSGFAVRASQLLPSSALRWEQWVLDSGSGTLREEQFTPGGQGNWLTVASGVVNSALAPFSLPVTSPGSPQDLAVDLQLSGGRGGARVELQSSVAAFDSPYTLAPSTPCLSALPQS